MKEDLLAEKLALIEERQNQILAQNKEILAKLNGLPSSSGGTFGEKIQNKNQYVSAIWNAEGANDKLVDFLEQWMFADGSISDKARLIYLCCLLERGQEELATVGLRKYCEERGTKLVCDFLPLAWLAVRIGIGGDVMKKAAAVFSRLEKERKENGFQTALQQNSFAVVGNSPDIIGDGTGEEIDARDLVFRMNTYIINQDTVRDTGEKVNGLVDNSNFATLEHANHQQVEKYKWIYIPYDFWHIQLSQFSNVGRFIDSYYHIVTNTNVGISWLFPEESIELKKRLRVISPTSGMAIFYSIYKRCGGVKREWFFGFSKEKKESGRWNNPLKDVGSEENDALQTANLDIFSDCDELSSFYKDAPCYSKGHNMNRELELRNMLFAESEK